MDDLLDRFIKSVGLMMGLLFLIYVLIASSSERPIGISLVIYQTMNTCFYWGFRILLFGVLAISVFSLIHCFQSDQRKQKEAAREKEKFQQQKKEAEEKKKSDEEQKRIEDEEIKNRRRLRKQEEDQRQIKIEQHLKNRSAEEANKDALAHFL